MRYLAASAAAVAIFLSCPGCGGSEEPSDWVAVVGDDTITTRDVTGKWNALRSRDRDLFRQTPDPDSALVENMINKRLLQAGARDAGYLELPEFRALGRGWARIEKSIAAREQIGREHIEGVDPEDLAAYSGRMGQVYWMTMYPDRGGRQISMHALDLPYERLELLDAMSPGEMAVNEMGQRFRLDSVTRVDPARSPDIDPGMYDDTLLTRMIGMGRARKAIREMVDATLDTLDVSVDSAGIFRMSAYLSGRVSRPPADVLVESDIGSWDGGEMAVEVSLARSRFPIRGEQPGHLLFLVENLLSQAVLSHHLERIRPEVADSIEARAESFLLEAAAESLYADSVRSLSVPGPGDLRRTWETGGDTIEVGERRSLELVVLSDRAEARRFEEARAAGRLEELLPHLPFLESLSADSPPTRFTRPLRGEDLPRQIAGRAFNIGPADTTEWYGPIGVPERGWSAFFRLREVVPPGHYDFQTSLPEVKRITRRHLEEQRMRELLRSLESRYGVEVNRELLAELPSDPEEW